jgi:ligand-binding sensor domain-containing protein
MNQDSAGILWLATPNGLYSLDPATGTIQHYAHNPDRVQLQQVLMNLMINAIDAMKDVGGARELAIKSQRAENEQLQVSVSDTGVCQRYRCGASSAAGGQDF